MQHDLSAYLLGKEDFIRDETDRDTRVAIEHTCQRCHKPIKPRFTHCWRCHNYLAVRARTAREAANERA